MPPATASAPAPDLLAAYLAHQRASGRGNRSFLTGARGFLRRWPDPQDWAREPLEVRLAAKCHVWPLLNFLMFQGHLRPGYDYLLERRLSVLWRELTTGPWAAELAGFQAAAEGLGYGRRTRTNIASQVAARLLIQTRPK